PAPVAAPPGRTTRSRAAAVAQPVQPPAAAAAQVPVGAGAGPARRPLPARAPPPAQAPAPQQAAAPAPARARAARVHAPPPPPNPAAANPAGFNLFNPLAWLGGGAGAPGGAGAAAPPVDPFFETLLHPMPNLEHLELYGRRYTAAIVEGLVHLPLRHLSLSVPDEVQQQAVVDQLLDALARGVWDGLRRIELSGRGGEWEPSQRRAVKVEAEKRRRVVYKSTDVRP
ncbi:hypothetical protein JCM9279_001322, partial [Rhodotorula babjevae]